MAKITYDNKVSLNPQPSVANINKVSDADMNEIKTCVNDNCTYSTNEICIGEWIDGKPLYRKVIETTTPAVSTDGTLVNKSVAVNVDNVDFIYVDKAIVQGGGNYNVSAIISNMSFNNGLRFEVNSTNIVMYCNSTIYGNAPVKVVVEYTKTTD